MHKNKQKLHSARDILEQWEIMGALRIAGKSSPAAASSYANNSQQQSAPKGPAGELHNA